MSRAEILGAHLAIKSGENIGYLNRIETVRPKELEKNRELRRKLTYGVIADGDVISLLAEMLGGQEAQLVAIKLFGICQSRHGRLHRLIDMWGHLTKKRHQLMANLIASEFEFCIGIVLDKGQTLLLDVGVNLGTREGQQRPKYGQRKTAIIGRHQSHGLRPNAMETGYSGAAKEVDKKSLDGIVSVVPGSHSRIAMLGHQLGKEPIAEIASRSLNR